MGHFLPEKFQGRFRFSFDQETLRGLSPPTVGVVEEFNQIGGFHIRWKLGWDVSVDFGRLSFEPIDPSHVFSSFEIGDGSNRLGEIGRMLDGLAVHIAEVECSIGSIREIDRAEPIVGGG